MDKTQNPIWQHHQKNVDEGTYVKNDDGSISTVFTTIMGDGEYEYLIPQVWDGKILSAEDAWDRAMSSGIDWPKEPSGEEGVRKLEQLDEWLHEGMSGYADGGDVSNFFDQSAEDLEFYIKELGYDKSDPTQAKFLRDEWTKQNTLSGQMKGAFGVATEVPEGRERAAIAPMTKPKGMTGLEAIRTGQAELAVPGFLTGVAEEALDTATTGQKMTSGISTTREEAEQAGMALGSATMAEVPRAMGRALREGVDRSVVSVGGSSVTKKKSEINPLFKPKHVSDDNLVAFYSPVKDSLDFLDFGEKGLSGSVVLKYLREKAPNTNIAELDSYKLNLDPNTKYTKEDVKALFPDEDYKVKEVSSPRYSNVQRQRLKDGTSDYFEISLQGNRQTPFYHLTDKDLGHARGSFINESNKKRLLIEEVQSDLLQNVGGKPKSFQNPFTTFLAGVDQEFESLEGLGVDTAKLESVVEKMFKEALDNETAIAEIYQAFGQKPQSVKGSFSGHLTQLTSKKLQEFGYTPDEIDERLWGSLDLDLQEDLTNYALQTEKSKFTKKDFPVTSNTDVTKKLLLGLIAKAQKEGATEIVMPPLYRIAALRARDFFDRATGFGQELTDSAVALAEKALKPTYVDSFEKATDVLNREFSSNSGSPIRVYEDKMRFLGSEFSRKGNETVKVLDITNFPPLADYKLRFAEGGEVKSMEEQMSLFERGGLADGGLDREPVTGNEVPPGSMPSEVRDDVPAQLSEGEYVVPADVVRYYGVKFFEDLRTEAKGGMMKMDQEGRIGGTAVDANGVPVEDDTLSPEEEQMLMEALASDRPQGMATGGMVRGYATAGDVTKPTYTPTGGYGAGPMQMGGYGQAGSFEARQYVNTATGQVRTFQFLNGMPISMIPEGFVPATQEAIAAAGQVKDQTTTETAGTGQATGQVEPEGRGFDPEKDTVSGEGRTKDPTAPFGIGTGKVGTGLAAGVVGGALTGGLGGALGFGKAGMQAGAFNEARNGLVDAMLSGDKDAIAKAKEDVTSTYGKLGNLAHIGVFNEGKTAQDAIAYVEKYTNDLMAKYNITPSVAAKAQIQARVGITADISSPAAVQAQLGSAANITAKDKAAGAAYAATGDAREDTWEGGGVAENQGWSGGQMDYAGDTQGGGAVGSARGGRATGGLVGKPSKNPPKKKSATKGLGGRR